jgi:hypothetical protein
MTPKSATPHMSRLVAIGRRINVSEMFMPSPSAAP